MSQEEADAIGISAGMYPGFRNMTPEEARTHRCDDCNIVLAVHPDARWRFQQHVIRCQFCQDRAVLERGYSVQDAMFVM